jgi:indolepyruvate ferredoxin oxidoreductase alpha subunit
MERLFTEEIKSLKLGAGETFRGEGILAVTKALLQSGVSYVGGYQGAPVSHLLDVMVQAREYMDELGVHVEACSNEASAAALLGASINYPARGAVTWKSIVGTNVAADALSNLASAGVVGGALIVLGEDYGEGASVIQERSHAYALKSSMALLDPRPDLPTIVRMVEEGFALSEASNTPVMMELRIRACHVQGEFAASANQPPAVSTRNRLAGPPVFNYDRLSHPPATFRQEKLKMDVRLPAARRFIMERKLNDISGPREAPLGLIVQGGLYNNLIRALQMMGLADAYGETDVPILTLNAVYPLVPEQITGFCAGKDAVLVVEEGQPEFIEHEIGSIMRRATMNGNASNTMLHGKDLLLMAGEYTAEVILRGLTRAHRQYDKRVDLAATAAWLDGLDALRAEAAERLGGHVPPRPPTFCTGCPERPVFSALKLVEREVGAVHVAGDIGCHALATFEPFSVGNSILGYGMGMASSAGVNSLMNKRAMAVMGDGGFWHNGLLSGIQSGLFNGGDGVLVIMKNGYSSATGTQEIISSPLESARSEAKGQSAVHSNVTIESTLKGMGVGWMRTVNNYRVADMVSTMREAFTSPFQGLKVIIAEGECQLERQRRLKPANAKALKEGKRVVRVRYGIDEAVCSGDHSCIRLSGCPSLTVKDAKDPLKVDPVAHVNNGCVGCGLCGEVAHAAVLCPSFYRAEIVQNPTWWDRARDRVAGLLTGWLRPA